MADTDTGDESPAGDAPSQPNDPRTARPSSRALAVAALGADLIVLTVGSPAIASTAGLLAWVAHCVLEARQRR
jgi:hypothetical protein